MKRSLLFKSIAATSFLAAIGVQAEPVSDNITINGFASIVAGMTVSEGTLANGSKATYEADAANGGNYGDSLNFSPDSMYGLQIGANLGDGLKLTGQVTGAGGADYDAKITWAYLSYSIDENWTVLAGRQRLPLFFYSDFTDVAYAYHWIRIPTEVTVPLDTLDGVQARYETNFGDWDARVQVYTGNSESYSEVFGGQIGLQDSLGAVFYANNDWLQLRATVLDTSFYADSLSSDNQDSDNPVSVLFTGLAAHLDFGDYFIVGEITNSKFDKVIGPSSRGLDSTDSYYVSAGYRINTLTPHVTYAVSEENLINAPVVGDATRKRESVTLGVRWDFHSQAALKAEYLMQSDKSDQSIIAAGGDSQEVDLINVGIDVTF